MSRIHLVLGLVAASILAAACGTTPPATQPPEGTAAPEGSGAPTAAPTGTAAAVAAPDKWSDSLSMDEKVAFMKAHVVGPLGEAFKAGDAAKYPTIGCKTCHGPSLKDTKEALPHLTLKDGKITSFAEKPEISKWMAEKVVPAMATALGEPPYDPATHKGFGCAGCHVVDMK